MLVGEPRADGLSQAGGGWRPPTWGQCTRYRVPGVTVWRMLSTGNLGGVEMPGSLHAIRLK